MQNPDQRDVFIRSNWLEVWISRVFNFKSSQSIH